MKIKRSDGHVFGFRINNIGRGLWVMEHQTVDGDHVNGVYSDPYPNERECRKGARVFSERATYTPRYGWCIEV